MKKSLLNNWKKRLLDVGKRNQLMNYRPRLSSNLEFFVEDINKFYKEYTDFKTYEIARLFKNLDEEITLADLDESEDKYDVKNSVTNALGTMIEKKNKYTREEIFEIKKRFKGAKTKNYLFCETISSKANQVLQLLKRKSKILSEENGIESLYMCFYFVHYKDKREYYDAPLVLVPSEILQKKISDTLEIKASDDDFQINQNLSYLLKSEYGIDISRVNDEAMEDYIKRISKLFEKVGFEVNERVCLGTFSFAKIMMYNDLDQNEKIILANPYVNLLLGNNVEIDNNILESKFIEEPVEKQNQVLEADSSQYKAIYYAKQGKSFVLQGPPGTGKSQTITNILAELIGQGKKVLFVCEKSSALEVVHSNLVKCGLDQYALPIYDTKANKSMVAKSIYQNIESISEGKIKLSEKGQKIIDKTGDYKDFLDDYLYEITKKRKPLNLSLDEIINDSLIDSPNMSFKISNINSVTKEEYQDLLEYIDVISKNLSNLSQSPNNNPFKGFKYNKISKKDLSVLANVSNELSNNLLKIIQVKNDINSEVFNVENILDLAIYIRLLSLSGNPYDLKESDFLKKDLKNTKKKLKNVELFYNETLKDKEYLLNKYKKSFLDIDVTSDLDELVTKYKSSIKRIFGYKVIEKKYSELLIKKSDLSYEDLVNDLTLQNELKEKYEQFIDSEVILSRDFPRFYFGSKTDFKKLYKIIDYLNIFNACIDSLDNCDKSKLIASLVNSKDFTKYVKGLDNIEQAIEANLDKMYQFFDEKEIDININDLIVKVKNISLNPESIYQYLDLLNSLNKIPESIKELKDELLTKDVDTKSLYNSFVKRFAQLLLEDIYESDNFIKSLDEAYIDTTISKYNNLSKEILEVSKVKIREEVTSQWPKVNSLTSANLMVSTLAKEVNKKKKLMSVRDLLNTTSSLVMNLKPIFMMSPLAVANYLEPTKFHFDCVIFDEASQINTEDAIGAIYRANQLIVVGDKEQLPPTSFFDSDLESEEDDEVFESVLDEVSALLPSIMLKWHYRSQDESLITYSNKEIYHDLTSFPANQKSLDLGLMYEFVEDGVYEAGKRVNLKEAERVVDLLFYEFRHNPSKSVGIVTFNMSQQYLIWSLINKKRKKDSAYESFFDESLKESLFVKNLETVQGDERDVIILSTTFGKNSSGKLNLNFGPINKEGGYRRLNVAITRAKQKLILVTSLDPSYFDMSKISNRGQQMLVGFIQYAKNRNIDSFDNNKPISNFVNQLGHEFNDLGYDVLYNLGSNQYKIDLAIVDKEDPKKLLACVLTDSKNYQKLKYSRDRNYLIDNVLKKRGWKVYHLFETTSFLRIKEYAELIIKDIFKDNKVEAINVELKEDEAEKIEEISEAETLDVYSLFDSYPNILEIIKEEAYKNISILDKVLNICLKTSPIKISELKRLISGPIFGKNLDNELDKQIDSILDSLSKQSKIYKIIGFVLKPSDILSLRFRKYDKLNQYNRTIDNIYIEEIEQGFLTVLNYVKQTTKTQLGQTFNLLLGYPKESADTHRIFNRVLNVLADKDLVNISGEVITVL